MLILIPFATNIKLFIFFYSILYYVALINAFLYVYHFKTRQRRVRYSVGAVCVAVWSSRKHLLL